MPLRQRNALKFFLLIVCSTDHSWQHPVQYWIKTCFSVTTEFLLHHRHSYRCCWMLCLPVLPTQRARSPTVAAARARGSKGLRVFNIQIKERNPAFVPEIIAIYGCVSVKGESFLAGRVRASAPAGLSISPLGSNWNTSAIFPPRRKEAFTPSSGLICFEISETTSDRRKPETITLLVVELHSIQS